MIGCLRTRVRNQPIIALYFEFENELKFYNLATIDQPLALCEKTLEHKKTKEASKTFNQFDPNRFSQDYQLGQSIFILRVVGWYISFVLDSLIEHSISKQWRP